MFSAKAHYSPGRAGGHLFVQPKQKSPSRQPNRPLGGDVHSIIQRYSS